MRCWFPIYSAQRLSSRPPLATPPQGKIGNARNSPCSNRSGRYAAICAADCADTCLLASSICMAHSRRVSARIRHTSAIHGSGFPFQLSPLSHCAACLSELASSRCQRLTSSLHRTADKPLGAFGALLSAVGELIRYGAPDCSLAQHHGIRLLRVVDPVTVHAPAAVHVCLVGFGAING